MLPVCVSDGRRRGLDQSPVFDKRGILSFLFVFLLFLLLGYVYAFTHPGAVADVISFPRLREISVTNALYGKYLFFVIAYSFFVYISGFTIFGRVVSVTVFFAVSFSVGVFIYFVISCQNSISVWKFVILALTVSVFVFAELFSCISTFVFSKRAFAGKRELLQIKPLLSYSVFGISLCALKLFIVFALMILIEST